MAVLHASWMMLFVILFGVVYAALDSRPNEGGIQLVLSHRNLAVRTGQAIRLNCTVLGSNDSVDAVQITWSTFSTTRSIRTRLVNKNTQEMEISSASASDSGKYRCTLQDGRGVAVLSKSAHVLVGDLPGRPENIRSYTMNWKICFKWSPVPMTSGLPVTYHVRYRCLENCGLDIDDVKASVWHVACKDTQVLPGGELSCCLDYVVIFLRYQAIVVAKNAVGSTKSRPVEFQRGVETTLSPPVALQGKPTGYGEILVTWSSSIPREESQAWGIQYVVRYHEHRASKNKSVIASRGQNRARLTDLKPYTRYIIYVGAAQGLTSSRCAIPAGPITVYTREENPSDAPEITNVRSTVCTEHHRIRNVTVKWKLPRRKTWNGIIRRFIIEYRKSTRDFNSDTWSRPWGKLIHVNSTAREAVVPGLLCDHMYELEMKMCNNAGCSGISNRIIVQATPQNKEYTADQSSLRDDWITIAVIGVMAMFVIVLIFALLTVIIRRSSSTGKSQAQIVSQSCYPKGIKGSTMPYKHMEGEQV